MNQVDVNKEFESFYTEKKLRRNIKFPVSFESHIEFDSIQMDAGDPKYEKKPTANIKFLKKKHHVGKWSIV